MLYGGKISRTIELEDYNEIKHRLILMDLVGSLPFFLFLSHGGHSVFDGERVDAGYD